MKRPTYPASTTLALVAVLHLSSCQKPAAVVDWRYTRWGMRVDEVKAASKGTAVPADPSDQPHHRSRDGQVLLKAPVSWEGLNFTACYEFEPATARLSSIALELQNATASTNANLMGLLKRQYGQPYSGHEDSSTRILVWKSAHDQIGFIKLTDQSGAVGAPATSVNYQPLTTSR